jgi:NTE family protein
VTNGGKLPVGISPRRAGVTVSGIAGPCAQTWERREPLLPPGPEPCFAVALSGGGFRATLSGLGVLRFFAAAGLLGHVRVVSSVSGGGVASGLLAIRYRAVADAGFTLDAFDDQVTRPLVTRISGHSLAWHLVANVWRAAGRKTRTDMLADALAAWWLGDHLLEDLPQPCRFVFNASNLDTSSRYGFEREVIGDTVLGEVRTAGTGLRVADAVAASAAFPTVFAPYSPRGIHYPCHDDAGAKLLDGAVYDNLALDPVESLSDPRRVCLVILNAGGVFRVGPLTGLPYARNLLRSSAMLYNESSAVRMQNMLERFKAFEAAREANTPPPEWARQGVLFGLATTTSPPAGWDAADASEPTKLAFLKTSFGRFTPEQARRLVRRGWWLTGANLIKYYPDLVPQPPADYVEP